MVEPSAGRPAARVWSVGGLVAAVASVLDHDFAACTLAGEVSGFARAASGHCYFTLKDPAGVAAIRCAMFRRAAALVDFEPRDGQRVELRGRVAVYEPRGELQFVAEAMQVAGLGALYERFLRLRSRLEAEGLFDPALKRPLPAHALALGIVTSLDGAALHDVATTLARRSPHVRAVIYPSRVQGVDAAAAICAAIATAARRNEVDVLIVCRGGGSLEDLWGFNDERVVRAIRAAPMPVVSGVGHETDVTLADLAADLRAPTPTAAAELSAAAAAPARQALDRVALAVARRMRAVLETAAQRIDRAALRLARPGEGVGRRRHALDLLAARLRTAPRHALAPGRAQVDALAVRSRQAIGLVAERARVKLDAAALRLGAVDPERVLQRGYALLVDRDERPVTSVHQLAPGDCVSARLADGRAELTTTAVAPRSGH